MFSMTNKEEEILEAFKVIYDSHRRKKLYHNLDHINSMLALLEEHVDEVSDPNAVSLAIWFHDIIYIPTRNDNEELSASLVQLMFEDKSSIDEINKIERLILVTKHDPELFYPSTNDEKYICDFDLASLGSDPETFKKNTENIRLEYSHLSDEEFVAGRKEFFKKMLSRKSIYYTETFKDLFEEQARKNIEEYFNE